MNSQLTRGDVVRDSIGNTWTVQDHIGTTVYVYGCMGKHFHRTHCIKIEQALPTGDFF